MSHTRGPWEAKESKYTEGRFVVQAGMPTNRVLAAFDGDGDGYDDTDVANAHLISAAPDLLAALIEAKSELRDHHHEHPVMKAIDAAIAKATQS